MHKKPMQRMFAAILSVALIFALATSAAATTGPQSIQADYTNIKVALDGKYLVLKDANGATVEPFAVAGTTYLPIRAVAGALGLGVEWDAATSTVVLTSGGEQTTETTRIPPQGRTITIGLTADYSDIKVTLDGKELSLTDVNGNTVEPFAVEGTTYLPVRAVANALGLEVSWDGDEHVVYLSSEPFTISADEAKFFLQGNLDEMYLGKYDPSYLSIVGITEDEAEATHLQNVLIESEFFCLYWGIVDEDQGESFETLDASLKNQVIELYKEIYSKSKYTVGDAVDQGNGNYAVTVKVSPINVMKLASDAYDNLTYAPFAQFRAKYTQAVINAMNDAQYQAYCNEYAQVIIDMVKSCMPSLDYLAEETLTVRVEKTANGTFALNVDDMNEVDLRIIDYPVA